MHVTQRLKQLINKTGYTTGQGNSRTPAWYLRVLLSSGMYNPMGFVGTWDVAVAELIPCFISTTMLLHLLPSRVSYLLSPCKKWANGDSAGG